MVGGALLGVFFADLIHAREPARFTSLPMLEKRLGAMRAPGFELEDASFEIARQRVQELFSELGLTGAKIRVEADPTKIVGFKPRIIPAPKVRSNEVDASLCSLQLKNIPLWDCLYFVASYWQYDITVRKDAIVLYPRDAGTSEPLITKEYVCGRPIMFPGGILPEKYLGQQKIDVREEISKGGMVHFYEGSFADYYPAKRKLVIRTTEKQHLNFDAAWIPTTCVIRDAPSSKDK